MIEALPWLVENYAGQFDFVGLVRRAKLENLQNGLGFVLQVAGVKDHGGLWAVAELERARLVMEDTLCWDSVPSATRKWMRRNRTALEPHDLASKKHAQDGHFAAARISDFVSRHESALCALAKLERSNDRGIRMSCSWRELD